MGPRINRFGTPLRTYCRSPTTPSYITICLRLKRWFSKSSFSTPLTPIDDRFLRFCAYLSVSNALLTPINIELVSFSSFMLFRMWSVKSVTAESVFRFVLKPNWWFDSKLFNSRNSFNCLQMHCSKIWENTGSTVMGR